MHSGDYLKQEEIIFKPYLNAKDIAQLGSFGINTAREIINCIYLDMEHEKIPTFKRRQKIVPTERVIAKLGLNASVIHREAERIRKANYVKEEK